ncbi:MAG: 2-hydroxyglutaryl-CoA dehydratase [Verrucomicrobia bacterium]|nr:2-hydroxyglutaryl-CoA dehydratase [Verrucomicrobiota bacterium]
MCAGIDAGSRAIKVVLIDDRALTVAGSGIVAQGVHQKELAAELLNQTLKEAGATHHDIRNSVATGYGRNTVALADTTITEITCHARGVHHQQPEARTVIDIGGQDSKLLHLSENGHVRDFAMNDRCAAGTGRFLEVVSEQLEVALIDIGALAAKADAPASISSMCVVFAETEIIGLLAAGESPENIVAGVQASIATRTAAMSGGRVNGPIVFTGGVAMIPGMAEALEVALGDRITIADKPQLTGALGAALLAAEQQ